MHRIAGIALLRAVVVLGFVTETFRPLGAQVASPPGPPAAAIPKAVDPTPTVIDAVTPIGETTTLTLALPKTSGLTIAGSFSGKADVEWDTVASKYLVTILPAEDAHPAELTLTANGATVLPLRIWPVPRNAGRNISELQSYSTPPDPATRDYTDFIQSHHPHTGVFNGAERKSLRHVQITGHRILLAPGAPQGLLERLMPGGKPADDIESLEIYAKDVVVAAPIILPGTTVHIYAQSLQFVDRPNVTSSITTTPVARSAVTIAGDPGADGESAGAVYLHIGTLTDTRKPAVARFLVVGGAGQQGGPQTDATRGDTLPIEPQDEPRGKRIGGIIRSHQDHKLRFEVKGELPPDWWTYATPKNVVWFTRNNTDEVGTRDKFPSDAKAGHAGGLPGTGGSGGIVHVSLARAAVVADTAGGASGTARPPAAGAEGGYPRPAVGIWIEPRTETILGPCPMGGLGMSMRSSCPIKVSYPFFHIYGHTSQGAPAIASPEAKAARGAPGRVVEDLRGWLHPMAVRATLRYAEDLYRLGHLTAAQATLDSLRVSLASADTLMDQMDVAYAPLRQRTAALRARLSTNLDYFGHPAGWVPAVNMATLLTVLKSETAASAALLVTTERVRQRAEAGTAQIADLTVARDVGVTEMHALDSRLNELAKTLPGLQSEAALVAQEEDAFLTVLAQRDRDLKNIAQGQATPHHSFLQKALGTLAGIAKVLPIGQPIAGAIGGALDLATNSGGQSPLKIAEAIPSVASQFSKANMDASVQSFRDVVSDVKNLNLQQPKAVFAQAKGAVSTVSVALAAFRDAQAASRAPASQVEAILQQLRAQDPSFRDLTDAAEALTARKLRLGASIDATVNEMGEVTSRVATLAGNLDVLNGKITEGQDLVDSPAIQAARGIADAVRDRLDRFHYLAVKAGEFYTAEPYSGNRNTASTADAIANLLRDKNGDPAVTATAFTSAYEAEVRNIGASFVTHLITKGPGQKVPHHLPLSPEQVAALNQMLGPDQQSAGDVVLPVEDMGIIPPTDYDLRILSVGVETCDCAVTSGGNAGASIRLTIASPERAVVRSTSRNISFVQPYEALAWGATINLATVPAGIMPTKTPDDARAVLEALYGVPKGKIVASPALLPGLSLRAELLPGPTQLNAPPTHAEIRHLTLLLTYAAYPRLAVRSIRVQPVGLSGVEPYFFVSTPDAIGDQHALGAFDRTYADQNDVIVVAPSVVAEKRFLGWYYDTGVLAGMDTRFQVPKPYKGYVLQARYGP